jgi:hypothetical protein
VHACNGLSPSCITLPVSANKIEVRVSMTKANNKQISQRHSSSALFLPLQWSWRSHSSGFGLSSKFVTSGVCLKSSLLPASVCLSCSLLMQLEKSQLLIQTLFQICRKRCVPALANKNKKREKSSKKRKKENRNVRSTLL